MISEVDRFLSHVFDVNGCWLWTGAIANSGYGKLQRSGKQHLAHRYAYELFTGRKLGALQANHACDTKRCVNPVHIWAGTQKENLRDAKDKGRRLGPKINVRGEAHGMSKLTVEMVLEMRSRHLNGDSERELASHFGIARGTAHAAVSGSTWSHV